MRVRTIFFVAAFFVILSSSFARADFVVWADEASGVSLSYPDTWRIVNNIHPDDVITVMAPSGRAFASCRVRVRADERFLVYPPYFSEPVQKIAYSTAFWDDYLAAQGPYEIRNLNNDAGIGKAFSTFAEVEFERSLMGPKMTRRALIWAGLYNGDLYITECSAHRDAFERWKPLFLSIAGSVDFRKVIFEARTGHYRNFLENGALPELVLNGGPVVIRQGPDEVAPGQGNSGNE